MGMTFGKGFLGGRESGKDRDDAKADLAALDLGIDEDAPDEEFVEEENGDDVDRGIERLILSASNDASAASARVSSTPVTPAMPLEDVAVAPAPEKIERTLRARMPASEAQRPLGERLVELGIVSRAALDAAFAEQERSPHKLLGKLLHDLDSFDTRPLARISHDPLRTLIDPKAIKLVPADLLRSTKVLPVSQGGGAIIIALADPRDIDRIEELRPYLPSGARIEPCFWPAEALEETIHSVLEHDMAAEAILKGLSRGTEERGAEADVWADPAVRLVNAALLDAVRLGASHAHFEPVDGYVRLRYRVDGAMQQSSSIDKRFWAPVAAHLRNISGIDRERGGEEAPGEFNMRLGDRTFMCALRAFETLNGERMTIRIGEIAREPMALSELGLSDHSTALILRSLVRPSGLIIAAGGRASGRTTSLYGMLGEMKAADRSIFTVERRIGYRLPLVSQLEVKAAQAADAAKLVSDVMAQDPDVVLFDKLEGEASARALSRAASAGRLVLTSMDAPDALSALIELMGLMEDPRHLTGRVTAIMAQRLVRRLCSVCKESRPASADECFIFGLDPADRPTVYHPGRCPSCRNTGHRGRTVVSEVLVIDDDMNDLIAMGAPVGDIRALAEDKGFQSLAEDGVRKVLLGEVSPRELARAVDLAARL